MNRPHSKPKRLFTFASGGWVVLLTMLVSLALIVWAVAPAVMRSVYHPPGDGRNIDSYQFDLSNLAIPRDEIVPITLHRDMVPVMFKATSTGPIAGDESETRWKAMQRRNDPQYGKYLVPSDRVIGVEVNGETRCYPISVMNVHEIINDALGGVPVAVTYNWPCDSVMVFDRRIDEKTLEFGVSGLLYNSNLLMYDVRRQAASGKQVVGGESLFSQLQARGVSGALAGRNLRVISGTLTTWRDWSAAHPQTTVLDRNLGMAKRYKDAAPTQYFHEPEPLRPVKPAPPRDGLPAKTAVVIVQIGAQLSDSAPRRVFPIPAIAANADKDGAWSSTIDGVTLRFRINRAPQTVIVQSDEPIIVMHAFWFAWHAMHPADEVIVR